MRDLLELVRVGGQRMRLLVVDHLQAVLDAAQEAIRLGELRARSRRRSMPRATSPCSARQRAAHPQIRLPSARDKLLRLHEKFDLADAAAPELQIVPLDGDLGMALMRVDLALHGVNVGDGGVVEIFAPDIRAERAQQLLARRDVARHGARLDERRALPVLAEGLVIMQRGVHGQRDLRGAGIGTQPQIGAEARSRRRCARPSA